MEANRTNERFCFERMPTLLLSHTTMANTVEEHWWNAWNDQEFMKTPTGPLRMVNRPLSVWVERLCTIYRKICCCDLNVCKDSLGITRKQSQHAKGSFVENKHLHSWEITKGIRNCKNDAEHQSICRSTSTRWTGDRTLNIHRRVNQYQRNSWDLFEHRLIKNDRIFYCQEMQPTQSGNTKVVEPLKWTKWQKKKVFKTTFRSFRTQNSMKHLHVGSIWRPTQHLASMAQYASFLAKEPVRRFSARKERWSYAHRRNRSVEAHIPGTCVEKHIDCEKFVGDTAQSRKWVPWHSWMVHCNDEL